MIYYPGRSDGTSGPGVVQHLAAELSALCGPDSPLISEHAAELARAVESFLEEQGGYCVDTSYLVMLASRALSSLGQPGDAQRVLLFGTGLVQPAAWEVSGADAMWVLDLKQMTVYDGPSIELVVFASLALIIEAMAEVWDRTAGEGILGLRHVCSVAASLLGVEGETKAGASLVGEIKNHCQGKLAQVGQARGWQGVPRVMNLDLEKRGSQG